MVSLDHEVFAIRDGERVELTNVRPNQGRWLAVMARSVEMPDGPKVPVRTCDSAPVEQAAILACEMNRSRHAWQWLQISPASKEIIGDLLFDSGAEKDRWYYAIFSDDVEQPKVQPVEGCCAICGLPMLPSESMFKIHGYSESCEEAKARLAGQPVAQ